MVVLFLSLHKAMVLKTHRPIQDN